MNARHSGVVHLRVGKGGVTPGIIEEVKAQLRRTDPLVIKFLQSFTDSHDRKEAARSLAENAGSRISSLTGGTLVLTRKQQQNS